MITSLAQFMSHNITGKSKLHQGTNINTLQSKRSQSRF